MPVGIRKYRPSDFQDVLSVERRAFPPSQQWSSGTLQTFLAIGRSWVAVVHGDVAGYITCQIVRGAPSVESVAVNPWYRWQGVASALVRTAERHYRRAGNRSIKLRVLVKNPAQTLYFNLGFRVTGFIRRRNKQRNVLRMEKCLKRSRPRGAARPAAT